MRKSVVRAIWAFILFITFVTESGFCAADGVVTARYLPRRNVKACDVPELMKRYNAVYLPVACVNWPGYPYRPDVKVAIAACRDAVLLHYTVDADEMRDVQRPRKRSMKPLTAGQVRQKAARDIGNLPLSFPRRLFSGAI